MNKEMFEEPMPGMGGFGMPSSRKKATPGVMALMRAVVSK